MDSAMWGLLGTLVGALASVGTTWLTSKSAHDLRIAASREDRQVRARDFQRQTLLDLQEAIHDSIRLTTRAHIEDRRAVRKGTAEWGENMLGDDLSEEVRLSQRRVSLLVERVMSDSLRRNVRQLMAAAHGVLDAANEGDAQSRLQECYAKAQSVLEALGAELRKHLAEGL